MKLIPLNFQLLLKKFPTLLSGKVPAVPASAFRFLLFPVFGFLLSTPCFSQPNIPLATWRLHLSYNAIHSVTSGDNKIFGATESGIMVFNRDDNSISTYNTLNGLSGTGISYIAFDPVYHQLIVAYADGNLDIIKNNEVSNFDRLKDLTTVTGSKTIHHITVRDDLAYLATDLGMVVFDLAQLELKETWRDLSALGEPLKIYASTFFNDSIFLATEKGVIAGHLNSNLLDFNNWKRFDTGDLDNPVQSLATFNDKLYAAIDASGIYYYENGNWMKQGFLQGLSFNALSSSANNLFIAETSHVWKLNTSGSIEPLETSFITTPLAVLADEEGNLWIGDQQNGLVLNAEGNYSAYLPDGPSIPSAFRLKFIDGIVYALAGGYSTGGIPLNNNSGVNLFLNGAWETSTTLTGDLTDIDLVNDQQYLASFGSGLEQTDNSGNKTVFDDTNSPLKRDLETGESVYVTAIESSGNDLWVANYGATEPLHVFNNNSWQSYSFATAPAMYPVEIIVDFSGNVWMVPDPAQGGGVLIFNKENRSSTYKTVTAGSGALPSQSVHSIAMDRDGYVWVGTDQGVAYFYSAGEDAIRPVFENRFLLRDEMITAIEVDAGNRKWIGTERGVWLFSPTGEELIQNFTVENSPLLSNHIRDIAIDHQSGEVFFSTDKGIISYRSDATESGPDFQALKIFPNPVTSDFAGTVGIEGLATDAIVKITDISGKLIWQTQANGGTATWNVRDYNGRRAATGIYLVFSATANGSESVVGKIAVIN